MDGQEAVTMDERPSVPRWVGEGEAGNRSLSPTEAWSCGLAGGLGCKDLRGFIWIP